MSAVVEVQRLILKIAEIPQILHLKPEARNFWLEYIRTKGGVRMLRCPLCGQTRTKRLFHERQDVLLVRMDGRIRFIHPKDEYGDDRNVEVFTGEDVPQWRKWLIEHVRASEAAQLASRKRKSKRFVQRRFVRKSR